MKHFNILATFALALLLTACAATQPPTPVPHWELLPPAGYGDD
jgi:hypothetical protein